MPHQIIEWLSGLPGPLQAFIAATIIAPLRIVYDRSERSWPRILIESLLCGCVAYGLASGASYFDVPQGVGVFIGSAVGFAGVTHFRALVMRYISGRLPS